ncbi:hypothetical protein PFISCL1PPCAC_21367, partial [Pristionchus fissidentatus]
SPSTSTRFTMTNVFESDSDSDMKTGDEDENRGPALEAEVAMDGLGVYLDKLMIISLHERMKRKMAAGDSITVARKCTKTLKWMTSRSTASTEQINQKKRGVK